MTDRNAAKKRRAAQNKAARDALVVRRTKAAEERPSPPPTTRDKNGGDGGDDGDQEIRPPRSGRRLRRASPSKGTADGDGDGGFRRPSRTASTRPARAASTRGSRPAATRPVREPKTGVGRMLAGVQQVPGGRAVLFGFLFSIVAAGLLLFAPITPRFVQVVPSQRIYEQQVANGRPLSAAAKDVLEKPRVESTYLTTVIGPAAGVVVVPVLIAGAAVAMARRPGRSRTFTFAAVAQVMFVVLLSGLGIFFLFSSGALGLGAYRARKADGPSPRRRSLFRPKRAGGDDRTGDDDGNDDGDDGVR